MVYVKGVKKQDFKKFSLLIVMIIISIKKGGDMRCHLETELVLLV